MSDATGDRPDLQGLIFDWGGVLTAALDGAMARWAEQDSVDYLHFRDVMRSWVTRSGAAPASGGLLDETSVDGEPVADLEQAPDSGPAGASPVHRLERGELTTAEFEAALAAELAARGSTVSPEGLLNRMLGGLAGLDPRMIDLIRRARAAGVRTGLLSNSWGEHYQDELFDGLFDAIVISGRVGMRKPEAEIFLRTCADLGLPPAACVMVDDLEHNIRAAVDVGMVGVLHRTVEATVEEVEILFDLSPRTAGTAPGT